MTDLCNFVADLMQAEGAIVEPVDGDCLDVVAPTALRKSFAIPELVRLAFGPERPADSLAVGLEGDWLERFGTLMGARGRLAERQLVLPEWTPPGAAQRLIDHAITLPNAVWHLANDQPGWTRLLLLTFRYTATSNEKREGLLRVGLNIGTGAVLDDTAVARYRDCLQEASGWQAPEPHIVDVAGPLGDVTALDATARALVGDLLHQDISPFLAAMRRRLKRDSTRLYDYHNDLRCGVLEKLHGLQMKSSKTKEEVRPAGPKPSGSRAKTGRKSGKAAQKALIEKATAGVERETMRVAAIERDYAAKIEDLRHNYALQVDVGLVQSLTLFAPVQRYELRIKRRKGERIIAMDWHPATRMLEPPPCDFGTAQQRTRHVCDTHLHLTNPASGPDCPVCSRPWCQACHPGSCPRCKKTAKGKSHLASI